MRFTHQAGQAYRHDIECTWFGRRLLRVREQYVHGQARLELPFGVIENEPKVDMAANLNLWGEAVWFPSVFFTDPRIRWEPSDEHSARLVVPFGEVTDSFTVQFDPTTGLLVWMEALRYRSAKDDARIPWRFVPRGWTDVHGLRIPSAGTLQWMDEATPWFTFSLDQAVYNVDVSQDLSGVRAGRP
jgi:hypothetical protein